MKRSSTFGHAAFVCSAKFKITGYKMASLVAQMGNNYSTGTLLYIIEIISFFDNKAQRSAF